jgi:hypothetical protein
MDAKFANVQHVPNRCAFCIAKTDSKRMLTAAIYVNVTHVRCLHVEWHVNTDLNKTQKVAMSVNVKLVLLLDVLCIV